MVNLAPADIRAWMVWAHLRSPLVYDGGPFAARLLWESEGLETMTRLEKADLFARLKMIWQRTSEVGRRVRENDPLKGIPHAKRHMYKVQRGVEPNG